MRARLLIFTSACTSARGRLCKYTSLFREGVELKLVVRDLSFLFFSLEVCSDKFDVADVFGHNAIGFL